MSSSRRDLLVGALFALLLALPVWAEKPADSRSSRDDSRYSPGGETRLPDDPIDVGGKTFDQWMADLKHSDPSVRATAISVIPQFTRQAEKAVPLLVERTHDTDASPRVKAVLALKIVGIRGTDRSRVVEALGKRISTDTQAIVRYEAAQALTRFGADGRAVIGDLVRGVNDSSTWELREACIVGIIVAGVDEKKGPDPRVTDALILRTKVFSEPTAKVRLEAIIALGALGRPQDPNKLRQVYGALQDHFNSTNHAIRIWAHVSKMALEDKVDKKYLDVIAGYLKDRDREVRIQAISALGALQGKAEDYLSNMLEMMRYEKDRPVLVAGCNALGRMKNKGNRVLQTLIRQTEREDAEMMPVVLAACTALAEIGAPTPEVMEALRKLVDRKDLNIQAKATVRRAIEEIQRPKDDETKPREKPRGEIIQKK